MVMLPAHCKKPTMVKSQELDATKNLKGTKVRRYKGMEVQYARLEIIIVT
jgi:hypothetical protein